MKDLSEEQRAALKSWLREPAARLFAEVIRREGVDNPFDLKARITGSVDNHGTLAYLIGKKAGFEKILIEMRNMAKS